MESPYDVTQQATWWPPCGVQFPLTNLLDLYLYLSGYESVFEKRAFGGEMDIEEMPDFLKECDLYPAQTEVEDAIDAVFRGNIPALFTEIMLFIVCPRT